MKLPRLTARQRAELVGDLHTYGGAAALGIGLGGWLSPWIGLAVFGAFLTWLGLFWRKG